MSDRDRELLELLEPLEKEGRLDERGKATLAEVRAIRDKAYKSAGMMTLQRCKKTMPKTTYEILVALIRQAQQLVGANNVMQGTALATCARDLLSTPRFATLTLDDIRLAFKMARCGDFGNTYERIAQHTVFNWLDKYIAAKQAEADNINYKLHMERDSRPLTDRQLSNIYASYAAKQVGHQGPTTTAPVPSLQQRGEEQRQALREMLGAEMPQI